MDSSPPMLQFYRDDEHASVAAPLLLINRHDAQTAHPHPRWSKQSNKNKNKNKNAVRGAIATGAFLATYLFICAWVAFANNGSSLAQREDSTAFPHPRFPWPFPRKRHPHPHPHHPPHPIVLGCTAIPSLSDVTTTHTAELNVSLPQHAVVLRGELLHKNVAVKKVNQSETEMMSEGCHKTNRTALVSIKVANRTWWHHHPHSPPEAGEEDAESTSRSFLLCAITFHGPHHGPHHPHHSTSTATASDMEMSTATATAMEMEEQTVLESYGHPHRPPHHRRPFHPPAVFGIFPAWNETHPKFPGHHGPPGAPEELPSGDLDVSTDSFLTTAWKSTVSFLFPMLNVFPRHPHHGHPCHHRPPPPPPFVVTDIEVTLPLWTRVIFGHGPPPHGPWRHH